LCLLLVNFLPQRRKQVLVLAGLAVVAAAGWWLYGLALSARGHIGQRDLLDQLLGGFALFRSSLVPAYWMARGAQAAAVGDLAEVGYSLALVWSNGLFLYVVTAWLAGRLYRRGYNRTATGGSLRRRYGGGWLDAAVGGLLGWLHPQTRLLVVKDFRTFRRDPAQWAQIAILMGLAVLYFTNIRRFYQQDFGRRFQNGIGLLNLTATAFMMCAYTGRFIYPLLSLEGRKFWILGLLPLQRDRLLWGKFAFSATGALLVAEFLVVLSGTMLDLPWVIVGVHVATVGVLALGLSGLSVGLGASLPNFRESDPSKIAVGFGGTLNLVVGLLFLLLMIGVMAAPWHLYLAARADMDSSQVAFPAWLWLGVALGVGLGALAAVLPLQAGARALRKMEF
jgi:ABC-2 type transport system permease protein